MTVFDAYAAYYDLLYAQKDYRAEAGYVDGLLRRHGAAPGALLELGSGTGGHALELKGHGWDVHGIDLSPRMVEQARTRAGMDEHAPSFEVGDIRDYRSQRRFPAVVSLFHVMSYQTRNADLAAAFATAAHHLLPGGLFVFDFWHGPGVLGDPPTTRVRRLRGEGYEVLRIAEPTCHPGENRVDVAYEVIVERAGTFERFREVHPMRYLFLPEVDLFLAGAGLSRVAEHRWMSHTAPAGDTWNACVVAVK